MLFHDDKGDWMKISAHTAENFSTNPPAHVRVCLFYGP